MATFVIVHGAWTGAWSWKRVAQRLRAKGHVVHVPTLSGLGERTHLNMLPINLGTHIDDVVNEILFHDLSDVVLVAHSYGGIVGTGVIERIKQRVASVVYLEAFIPGDGQGFIDFAEGWQLNGQLTEAPPSSPGDYLHDGDRTWVESKATPQPTATFLERIKVTGAYKDVPRKTYIVATGWDGFSTIADAYRNDPQWQVHEIACGHDVPIDMPEELSALLEGAAP
jgi:pimeloyl-ACP methyl ester carboxylesterase